MNALMENREGDLERFRKAGHAVVGVAGPKGGGKTAFALRFRDFAAAEDVPVLYLPLAAKLKEIFRLMGWNGQKDARGRRGLQLLGTEVGRKCIHEDVWVRHWRDRALHEALRAEARGSRIVVLADDVRFVNEADVIHRMGGRVVEIAGRVPYENEHDSEKRLPSGLLDAIVDNGGSLEDLERSARRVWEDVREALRRPAPAGASA